MESSEPIFSRSINKNKKAIVGSISYCLDDKNLGLDSDLDNLYKTKKGKEVTDKRDIENLKDTFYLNISKKTKFNINNFNYNNLKDLIGVNVKISGESRYYSFSIEGNGFENINENVSENENVETNKILKTGYSFVQLDFINNFGGFKSWSYARGYIRDASGVNHNTVTGPLGCTNTGGKTVIEATTSSVAAIVKNTSSTVIIPMYASCTGDNYGEISVPFLVQ
jgi:hypothetical protein